MKHPPVDYNSYIGVDTLTSLQKRESAKYGKPAHEEMLFLIVHQTYELWFRQMIFELDSVREIFAQVPLQDAALNTALARLERIVSIQKFINGQIDLLETMSPLEFLEFRDYLYPASGFQSVQWRLLETKLGLSEQQRHNFTSGPFYQFLPAHHQNQVKTALQEPSLWSLVEAWLARTPYLQSLGFAFWTSYQKVVDQALNEDIAMIEGNSRLPQAEKEKSIAQLRASLATFAALLSKEGYEKLRQEGVFRFEWKALMAALLVMLYRHEPALHHPYRLLSTLVDLDEKLTEWRSRHAQMAARMLGRKIGTGGSSGHEYLKRAADQHVVFGDLIQLTTFYLPRSRLPELPVFLERRSL